MPQVIKSVQAKQDLEDLYAYIGIRNASAAERFLRAAERAMEQLGAMPTLAGRWKPKNRRLREIHAWSIREFKNYVIFYRPITDGIEVLRVLQGARDIEKLF